MKMLQEYIKKSELILIEDMRLIFEEYFDTHA